ncbi:putative sulfatase-modifying factor [Pseudescherichia vulneris NBRC 102420]|uniref:Putative sulfatase-modifying factor n=1 Tax=Pseudescherichia vulneris NBRC 102420 TaxID=1115515 RepID=A0A090V4L4_PSEVU|nr:SUMF1/EgtB/PvdO family nonheme iron enzyme [Pseudescherichia vulneris]GAL58209.1 putative sulfatase-modifying factor [Pseudescherichia vulneris NBRC 102420]STQ59836.1 Serine/threonine-protein kinase pkn1 [Pseudescherichia vulneris]
MKKMNIEKILLLLIFTIVACDSSSKKKELTNKLVDRSIADMVSIKGGDFLMGDFGPLVGEKLPFSIQRDDKILHKVILSDFMISKYKVTNADYKIYLEVTGIAAPPVDSLAKDSPSLLSDNYSVTVTWQRAKDYCLWLGNKSGKKVDLPTEAQWEYAARSEGKYLPFATDNGKIERGKNYPTFDELDKYTDGLGLPIYPIGKYPPNPSGLYDMGLSGKEWTNDWYASDYYSHSPAKDPQGPAKGKKKVQRGAVGGDDQYALTMFRQSSPPNPKPEDDRYDYDTGVFRCVINK